MQNSKRTFLKGMLTLSATAAVAGCGLLDLSRFDPERFNIPCDGSQVKITDAHAHFFNASDLNFANYLKGPVVRDFGINANPFFEEIFSVIAEIVQFAGNVLACSAYTELFLLKQPSPKLAIAAPPSEKVERFNNEIDTVVTDLFEYLEKNKPSLISRLDSAFFAAQKSEINKLTSSFGLTAMTNDEISQYAVFFNRDNMTKAAKNQPSSIRALNAHSKQARELNKLRFDFFGIIDMIHSIFAPRSTNIQKYFDRYSKKSVSVHKVMAVSCDFDYWLGRPNHKSSQKTQIKLYEKLAQLTNGYIIPVLGVNPYKLAISDKYKKLVNDTMQRGIFKGVKLYPTLGYSADGRDVEFTYNPNKLTPNDIYKALDELYSNLGSDRFVMSHARDSMSVSDATELFSGHEYWEKVLAKHKHLRVNFGHLAGAIDERQSGYFKLMQKYHNVYGDLGFWNNLKDISTATLFISRVRNDYPSLLKKIMFGSDWFMILQDGESENYLDEIYANFYQLMQDGWFDQEELDDLFSNNALRLAGESGSC